MSEVDLQMLRDERDIVAVAVRYCRSLDTKHFEGLRDVFIPDATAELGNPSTLDGIDAIIDRCRTALDRLDLSQHLVGTHEVTVADDVATHACYLQAQHVRAGAVGGANYLVGGRYTDDLVRAEVGWRIAHRTLTVMWTDGNLAVIRGD